MAYRAEQGDIIWLNFDPQAGHEQIERHRHMSPSKNPTHNATKNDIMVISKRRKNS